MVVVCCLGSAGGGLKFRVSAPNLAAHALCFLFSSSTVAGKNYCQGVLENETKAKAKAEPGTFTGVTGETKLPLIKKLCGGHTMLSLSFMLV